MKKTNNTGNYDFKGYKLSRKKQKLLQLCLEGELSTVEMAEELGVSRQTVWRWRNDDGFKAALQAETDGIKRRAMQYLDNKAYIAVKKYWELAECSDNRTKEAVLDNVINRSIGKVNTPVSIEDKTTEGFDLKAALAEIKAKMGKE